DGQTAVNYANSKSPKLQKFLNFCIKNEHGKDEDRNETDNTDHFANNSEDEKAQKTTYNKILSPNKKSESNVDGNGETSQPERTASANNRIFNLEEDDPLVPLELFGDGESILIGNDDNVYKPGEEKLASKREISATDILANAKPREANAEIENPKSNFRSFYSSSIPDESIRQKYVAPKMSANAYGNRGILNV
ncbi:hypothetical protein MHBO_004642, partial [Bonamia ostreae]